MKKILQILGMISMMLLSFLPASSYDFEVDGIYYNILSAADLTCEVTSSPDKYTGTVTIPSTVSYKLKDLTVVAIGERAFSDCSELKSLNMPQSVKKIDGFAFSGCGFATFDIPNSIKELGEGVFAGCNNLTSFNWPEYLIEIPKRTFYRCSNLINIDFPKTIVSIGEQAFYECSSLENVSISSSSEGIEIGIEAFAGCSILTKIDNCEHIINVSRRAFYGCRSLECIQLPKGNYIGGYAFGRCVSLREIGVPRDVYVYDEEKTSHGSYSLDGTQFKDCDNIQKLTIYSDLHENPYVGPLTFEKCCMDKLRNVKELDLRSQYLRSKIDSLEVIYIGNGIDLSYTHKNGDNYDLELYCYEKLRTIYCGDRPPKGDKSCFTNSQYINTIVYVPYDSYETYTQTEPWKYFWNLERMGEPSKVSDITTDVDLSRTIVNRYDLNGRVVSDNYKGIVIVLFSDGTSKKIVQN